MLRVKERDQKRHSLCNTSHIRSVIWGNFNWTEKTHISAKPWANLAFYRPVCLVGDQFYHFRLILVQRDGHGHTFKGPLPIHCPKRVKIKKMGLHRCTRKVPSRFWICGKNKWFLPEKSSRNSLRAGANPFLPPGVKSPFWPFWPIWPPKWVSLPKIFCSESSFSLGPMMLLMKNFHSDYTGLKNTKKSFQPEK